MASYAVELTRRAQKQYKELDKPVRKRIDVLLAALTRDPRPADAKPLTGEGDLLRARIGDWRIIYRVDHGRILVLVLEIGHRGQVYRRMR